MPAEVEADDDLARRGLGRRDEGVRVFERRCQRLLDEHVLAGGQRRERHVHMARGRHGHGHGLDGGIVH